MKETALTVAIPVLLVLFALTVIPARRGRGARYHAGTPRTYLGAVVFNALGAGVWSGVLAGGLYLLARYVLAVPPGRVRVLPD